MHCLVLWFVVGPCPTLLGVGRPLLQARRLLWSGCSQKAGSWIISSGNVSVILWVQAQGDWLHSLFSAFSESEAPKGGFYWGFWRKESLHHVGRRAGWQVHWGSHSTLAWAFCVTFNYFLTLSVSWLWLLPQKCWFLKSLWIRSVVAKETAS